MSHETLLYDLFCKIFWNVLMLFYNKLKDDYYYLLLLTKLIKMAMAIEKKE